MTLFEKITETPETFVRWLLQNNEPYNTPDDGLEFTMCTYISYTPDADEDVTVSEFYDRATAELVDLFNQEVE